MNFIKSRKEALDVMENYIEKDIFDYTVQRNFDFGPQNRKNVSCLSPYITHRLISEYEVVKLVLNKHPYQKVEKFERVVRNATQGLDRFRRRFKKYREHK